MEQWKIERDGKEGEHIVKKDCSWPDYYNAIASKSLIQYWWGWTTETGKNELINLKVNPLEKMKFSDLIKLSDLHS